MFQNCRFLLTGLISSWLPASLSKVGSAVYLTGKGRFFLDVGFETCSIYLFHHVTSHWFVVICKFHTVWHSGKMSAHTWQIWRVREAFSDSSGNEFRWGANRTLLEAFWTAIDVNQLNNLIEFVFVEGSEPSPYLCAHKISRLLQAYTFILPSSLWAPWKKACAKADFTITTCICCVLDLTSP